MIQILEENNFFIVINKPSGVSVHNETPSLAEFLRTHKLPLHFVNRLDRNTSGLLLVAMTPSFHQELANALQNGEKIYRALLRGAWKGPPKTEWKWPLTDKSEGLKNPQGISSERVPCESHVDVVRTNNYFTECLISLLSGRQHQIRKHAALAKHPLVGDNRYNDKAYNKNIAARYSQERLWLHAEKIKFLFKGKEYYFENNLTMDLFFSNTAKNA